MKLPPELPVEGVPLADVTPGYGLPYPLAPDPPNVPADIQALAERLEVVLAELEASIPEAGGGGAAELAYVTLPGQVNLNATSGAQQTILTAPALTFDGAQRALIEFFAVNVLNDFSAILVLWDGAAQVGNIAVPSYGGGPAFGRRIIRPTAGEHTFSIRGYTSGGACTIYGGPEAGGAGWSVPIYLRITEA